MPPASTSSSPSASTKASEPAGGAQRASPPVPGHRPWFTAILLVAVLAIAAGLWIREPAAISGGGPALVAAAVDERSRREFQDWEGSGGAPAAPEGDAAAAARIPWYLAPAGMPGHPWRWCASVLVHVHWREVVGGLAGITLAGAAVEALLGWRRLLPLLAGLIPASALIAGLAGLAAPAVVPRCGSAALVAVLAGLALVWSPAARLGLGRFRLPVWVAAGLALAAAWAGSMAPRPDAIANLAGGLVLGLSIGVAAAWLGWIPGDGDVISWWRRRPVPARAIPVRRPVRAPLAAAAAAGADPAPLLAAAEADIASDLDAGRCEAAFAAWRAVHGRWPGWALPVPLLDRIARGLEQVGRTTDAALAATALIEAVPVHADARLILATAAVEARLPQTAGRHLAAIPAAARTGARALRLAALRAQIDALAGAGVREVEFL